MTRIGGLSNFDLELELYCLAHRKAVRFGGIQVWWYHVDSERMCSPMWNYPSPRKPDARYSPPRGRRKA